MSSTTSTRSRASFSGTILPCTRRRAHAEPDREVERRPGAGLAFEPDAAAHQLDQAAADRQAETGAAMLARRRHVGLRERLKQLRRLLGRHADPGVAHGALELHLLAGPLDQLDVEPNLAALGELHGVVDQVGQDLPETQRIAEQMFRDRRRDVRQELEALVVGLLRRQRRDRADHVVQPEVRGLDIEPAGLDLRKVEDVVDHGEQRRAGVVDLAHVVALLRGERRLERQMRQADDGVHRRADLVAHVREEHRLHLVASSALRLASSSALAPASLRSVTSRIDTATWKRFVAACRQGTQADLEPEIPIHPCEVPRSSRSGPMSRAGMAPDESSPAGGAACRGRTSWGTSMSTLCPMSSSERVWPNSCSQRALAR